MAFARYLGRRAAWYVVVLFVALLLNFLLPRLVPGNPVDAIVANLTRGGGATGEAARQTYETNMAEFGLDKPLWQQHPVRSPRFQRRLLRPGSLAGIALFEQRRVLRARGRVPVRFRRPGRG